jgi:antitoxin HigA-1
MDEILAPIHPGEMLREDFMSPLALTAAELAKAIAVDPTLVEEIVAETRAIDAETALRLDRYFGRSEGFWTRLQASYDVRLAKYRSGARIEAEVTPRAA